MGDYQVKMTQRDFKHGLEDAYRKGYADGQRELVEAIERMYKKPLELKNQFKRFSESEG